MLPGAARVHSLQMLRLTEGPELVMPRLGQSRIGQNIDSLAWWILSLGNTAWRIKLIVRAHHLPFLWLSLITYLTSGITLNKASQPSMHSWPLDTGGLGAQTSRAVESPRKVQSALGTCRSPATELTLEQCRVDLWTARVNRGNYPSTSTHVVQTHVVQGSTVLAQNLHIVFTCCLVPKRTSETEGLGFGLRRWHISRWGMDGAQQVETDRKLEWNRI